MDEQVEIIKSNKGGMKVIHKGYMYTVHKKRQCGGIRWRCAQRSLHCKGSISTGTDGPPKFNMPHNHLPDFHSVALARGRQHDEFNHHHHPTQLLDMTLEEDQDSMPLQERLTKTEPLEAQPSTSGSCVGGGNSTGGSGTGQPLKSQPLSPTKLRVTRHSAARLSGPGIIATTKPQEPPPPSAVNEEMCLRWNSHHSNMQTAFPNILNKEQYVDCTLASEGKTLKCHRMILSSCSSYFEEILSSVSPFQHPVLFMRDIPFWILKSLCDFMYAGEVHIYQNKLQELLKVAELLKIKGLAGKSNSNNSDQKEETKKGQPPPQHQQQQQQQPQQSIQRPHRGGGGGQPRSSYDDEDILDPLELLEPLYEEEIADSKNAASITKLPPATIKPKEFKFHQIKKPLKKIRKRKLSEQREPSPPPFTFRKGTRSRPHVKIPKYYHTDFNTNLKPSTSSQNPDPLLEVDEIKTEPIDVEDTVIDYEENDERYEDNESPTEIHAIQSTAPPPSQLPNPSRNSIEVTIQENFGPPKEFKKIRLSKPIISEVHSVGEGTPLGGLEVIKITTASSVKDQDKGGGGDKSDEIEGETVQLPNRPRLIVKKITRRTELKKAATTVVEKEKTVTVIDQNEQKEQEAEPTEVNNQDIVQEETNKNDEIVKEIRAEAGETMEVVEEEDNDKSPPPLLEITNIQAAVNDGDEDDGEQPAPELHNETEDLNGMEEDAEVNSDEEEDDDDDDDADPDEDEDEEPEPEEEPPSQATKQDVNCVEVQNSCGEDEIDHDLVASSLGHLEKEAMNIANTTVIAEDIDEQQEEQEGTGEEEEDAQQQETE